MKFSELKFVKGICQLDYNYYVLSFAQIEGDSLFDFLEDLDDVQEVYTNVVIEDS